MYTVPTLKDMLKAVELDANCNSSLMSFNDCESEVEETNPSNEGRIFFDEVDVSTHKDEPLDCKKSLLKRLLCLFKQH